MVTTFKEVSETKTGDFGSLAAGDCFSLDKTYYMKLITEYKCDDDDFCCNSINLKTGVLTFFSSESRVKLYKNCEVILYE